MAVSGWRLSRGRGPSAGQISLAICGVLAIVVVLLGKAENSFFDGVRAKLSDWTSPILEGVREPLSGLQKWVVNIGGIFTVYEDNIRLKQEVAELRKWQEVAGSLQRRIQRYEILLKAVPNVELNSVQARVIGQSSRPFIKTMILNAGSAQGVKAGQAVIDDRGLIGRIYLTGNRTAWVILLTDLNSRVPVSISPSNRRAMILGDNSTAPTLELDTGFADIHAGDRVYSSGDGGQLPPGLPVGVVVGEDGSFRVALFADSDATDYVHIVDYQVAPQPSSSTAAQEMPVAPLLQAGSPPAPPAAGTPIASLPTTPGAVPPGTTQLPAAVGHVPMPAPKPAAPRAHRPTHAPAAAPAPANATTAAVTTIPAPVQTAPAPAPEMPAPHPAPAAPQPATEPPPVIATPDNSPGPEPDQ